MAALSRLYQSILQEHLREHRQMAFVTGPRQVGKTTICRALAQKDTYFSWDHQGHRQILLRGPDAVFAEARLDQLAASTPVLVFDELHKYPRWKSLLKGCFDVLGDRARIVVTGSSRLDVFRRGGDSLMGRYFLYHMHPLSVAELVSHELREQEVRPPSSLTEGEFEALWTFGGYPEPFLKRDRRFTVRWQTLRIQQLIKEDLRDLTRIQELGRIEVLVALLSERSASSLVLSSLARDVNTSVDTTTRWLKTLCSMHFGFLVRPYFRNVAKSLRKEPKWYLRDWSTIADPGQRAETFIACHLLKAVEGWQDLGLGKYALYYLRDKQQREVDFLVVRNGKPWFLVEAKVADPVLSKSLAYFQQQVNAPFAFQAVLEMAYVKADCFARTDPCVVPARTLLSQLL